MLTQPCTLQPWSRSSPQNLVFPPMNSAWCRQAGTLHPCCAGRAPQCLCSPDPGSSGSVAFRWSRRGSVLQRGCVGCLGKGGLYRGLSCGWEVVNPCEKAKHKGGGYFWRLFTLAQGETSLSCVYATPSWHSSRGFADRTMQ